LPFVRFGESDSAAVGDWVVAIGNPFGFGGTATAGIISARGRDLQSGPYVDFIQIDASINSGNSGGPVFGANGDVIGINTAIYSPNGGNVGLGFAIPANDAQIIVNELRDRGVVKRGWLGVQSQDVDDALADSLGLETVSGALIADIVSDSPAANAGAEIGDVIVEFDGDQVINSKALARLVSRAETGTQAKMIIVRNGKRQALRPRIDERDDNPTIAAVSSSSTQFGLQVVPLTSVERDQLGIDESVDGVVVVAVNPNGEAARKGIRRGDVISRVNRDLIHTPNELLQALADSRSNDHHQVAVLVHRGSTRHFVTLGLS
jgi:serine protease Do